MREHFDVSDLIRTRSLDTAQGDKHLQVEAVSVDARASSAKQKKVGAIVTNATLENSVLLSIETSHFERSDRSNLEIDSQMTPAKCQEAMVCGKPGPAFSSSVLSFDGTLHFERGDRSILATDPQMTPAKRREEAA